MRTNILKGSTGQVTTPLGNFFSEAWEIAFATTISSTKGIGDYWGSHVPVGGEFTGTAVGMLYRDDSPLPCDLLQAALDGEFNEHRPTNVRAMSGVFKLRLDEDPDAPVDFGEGGNEIWFEGTIVAASISRDSAEAPIAISFVGSGSPESMLCTEPGNAWLGESNAASRLASSPNMPAPPDPEEGGSEGGGEE